MEKHSLNIDKVSKIEDLFNAGWLFQDMKRSEIILETSDINLNPVKLKAIFIILCEGVFNSNRRGFEDTKVVIDYEQLNFSTLESVANELTFKTGIYFSSALIF
jgi:hypothetical protein